MSIKLNILYILILSLIYSCATKAPVEYSVKGIEDIENKKFKLFLVDYNIIGDDFYIERFLETPINSRKYSFDVAPKFIKSIYSNDQNCHFKTGYVYFGVEFIAVFTFIKNHCGRDCVTESLLLQTFKYRGRMLDYSKGIISKRFDLLMDDKPFISQYIMEFYQENEEFEILETRLYGSDRSYLDYKETEVTNIIIGFNSKGKINIHNKAKE